MSKDGQGTVPENGLLIETERIGFVAGFGLLPVIVTIIIKHLSAAPRNSKYFSVKHFTSSKNNYNTIQMSSTGEGGKKRRHPYMGLGKF